MQIVWDSLSRADWTASLPAGTALQQQWRYGAAAAALGRAVHRAEIVADGRRVGLAQCIARGRVASLALVSCGPVWLAPLPAATRRRALGALAGTLPGHGVLALAATPAAPGRAEAGLPVLTGPSLAQLPLDADPDRQRRRMGGKWRGHLNAALRADLHIASRVPSPVGLDWLIARDRARQRERGYRALPPAFIEAWRRAGPGPGLRLYTAGPKRAPVAAMLFLVHDTGAAYHLGWSGAAGRALSAHHLILWQATRDFVRQGLSQIELGTVDTVCAPGLARFKLGAGAEAHRLGTTGLVLSFRSGSAATERCRERRSAPRP